MIAECIRLQHKVFGIELPPDMAAVIEKSNEIYPEEKQSKNLTSRGAEKNPDHSNKSILEGQAAENGPACQG